MPVETLIMFELSYFVSAWIKPSRYVGSIIKTDNKNGIYTILVNNTKILRYPKCIPVHRAQVGNCLPLQKNERSGFL